MLNKDEISRYSRQISLLEIGFSGQIKLKQAKVLVIGAGGLGCPVLQYLCAAGIGVIGIMDGDKVSMSNLQRQILFSATDIGKAKVVVLREKLFQLNPNTEIVDYPVFLNAGLAVQIFKEYDLVVDCTDNFESRYLINDVCVLFDKPFVSAAIYHFEGQVACYNLQENDGAFSCNYRDVYAEIPDATVHLNCNAAGVMATLPGLMGLYQANEVLKYFVNKKQCMRNELLFVNAWNLQHFSLALEKNGKIKKMTAQEILNYNYSSACSVQQKFQTITDLNAFDLSQKIYWIDVREKSETPAIKNAAVVSLPLSIIERDGELLAEMQEVVFFCQSGNRSAKAAYYFVQKFPKKKVWNYKGELQHLIKFIHEKKEMV